MQSNVEAYAIAVATRAMVEGCHRAYVLSEGQDQDAHSRLRASVPTGLYEHWKSEAENSKFYVVSGAGTGQDTHVPLVGYAALYPPHAGILTFRHLLDDVRGFLTPINRDVYQGPRFKLVLNLTHREIAVLLDNAGELSVIHNSTKFRVYVSELLRSRAPIFSL